MTGVRGIKRLLMGIELTIIGIALVAASSGSAAAIGVVVVVAGFFVAFSGLLGDT